MKIFHPLALIACVAAMAGCNNDDDDDDGGSSVGAPVRATFTDDFSDGFPGSNWTVEQGSASIDNGEGNEIPALSVSGDDTRVRTNFRFSSSEPFTLSFQLRPVTGPEGARFEFRLERVAGDDQEVKFDLRLEDGQVRLEILEAGKDDLFPTSDEFHTVTFAMSADRTATWSIDGTPLLTRADFPDALWRIELRSTDAGTAEMHLDNVELRR